MTFDSTVHYVEMFGRAGLSARPRRMARRGPPRLDESAYAKALITWLGEVRLELLTLPGLMSEPRFDSVRLDESPHGRRVRQLTEPVRRKIERDAQRFGPEIERAGGAVTAKHKQLLDRQTKAALGVEVPLRDEAIPRKVDAFVSRNMTRIHRLGDNLIGEVEAIVIDAWDKGLSETDVAAAIQARIGVAESHARFLARDQMGTLYAQVTRARHQELGVRLFQWNTQADGRVRPAHRLKHNKVFPYEGSRAPSFFPGEERGCRCWETPVFDEIKAKAFAGKGRTRR